MGSSRSVDCKFTPTDGYPELYTGRINKIGLDLGWKRGGVLAWAVLSPGLTRGPGALAGNYVGAPMRSSAAIRLCSIRSASLPRSASILPVVLLISIWSIAVSNSFVFDASSSVKSATFRDDAQHATLA